MKPHMFHLIMWFHCPDLVTVPWLTSLPVDILYLIDTMVQYIVAYLCLCV